MAIVLTFSRTFPGYHPKAGQPTYFVEKFLASLDDCKLPWTSALNVSSVMDAKYYYDIKQSEGKHHTIRAGKRWKVGDKFSPRVWSGKPYNSKQIIIAPDVEVKKVWGFELKADGNIFIDGDNRMSDYEVIAKNDGLSGSDLLLWFPKPFIGQIICWNENINY